MNALQSSPALAWLLSYLFNALWQIPLLFAAAWLASRLLRRFGPHAEHRLWVGALLLQIVLPATHLSSVGNLWTGLWTMLHGLLSWTKPVAAAGDTRVLVGPGIIGVNSLHLPPGLPAAIGLAYACTLLYFAARLAWGLYETRTLARSKTPFPLTGDAALRWSRCCHRLGIAAPLPEIATSPQAMGPVTVGLLRALVLVPPALLQNTASSSATDDLDAVLAHELAHIARYDFAKNLLYGLVSLPISWHPVLWRTRARVSETRELICDATAAEAVAGRTQYAQSLLRLASMLVGRPRVRTLHAIGIFNLSSDPGTFERRIMVLTHKRTPVGATRGVLITAACAILALATCTSAIALRTEVGAMMPTADTAAPAKIHVKAGIMTGLKIAGDNPTYPPEARAKKIQGAVVLAATIGKDGGMENLQVLKSPSELLSKSALDAVRTWRYRPYLLNGEPVEVETTINVVYNLAG